MNEEDEPWNTAIAITPSAMLGARNNPPWSRISFSET
jgi:hypothetical protein